MEVGWCWFGVIFEQRVYREFGISGVGLYFGFWEHDGVERLFVCLNQLLLPFRDILLRRHQIDRHYESCIKLALSVPGVCVYPLCVSSVPGYLGNLVRSCRRAGVVCVRLYLMRDADLDLGIEPECRVAARNISFSGQETCPFIT